MPSPTARAPDYGEPEVLRRESSGSLSSRLRGSPYSGQNKRFWLTETAQYKNDLYADELELTKAINQIQSGSRIQEELLELKGEIRKNPPPIFYYNTLRPRILKALSQI